MWRLEGFLGSPRFHLGEVSRGSGGHFVDDPRETVACCSEVDPSVFVGVPRFYERLHDVIRERLKVRRAQIAARHARLLDDLYREEPQAE